MSNSNSIKNQFSSLYDNINDNKKNYKFLNRSIDSIESISQNENNSLENFHLFCNGCPNIPILNIDVNSKIKFLCNCKTKKISIKDILDHLYYSKNKDIKELKCKIHPDEKYIYYCHTCKKNLCLKCTNGHSEHEIEYIEFILERVDKNQYIKEETSRDFDDIKFDIDNEDEENFPTGRLNDEDNSEDYNDENENSKDNLIKTKDFNNQNYNEEIKKIYKIISEIEEIFQCKKLFKILLFDLSNYPNYKLLETISNFERYIIFFSGNYNSINLHYIFNQVNIKDNKIELFGDTFVNNNKDKCFLIINENIVKLERFIDLKDIFDEIPIERPIILDVQLIVIEKNLLINTSFMFNEICTITNINFNNYNNIKNMGYMFYNCKLLQYIEIYNLKTEKVTDMSYMFFNCSSLQQIQDLSKWEFGNLENADNMFSNCSSLSSIPNIANWELKKIKKMNYMFKNCKSLLNISETLNWNISEKVETEGMYEGIKFSEDNIILRGSKYIVYFSCFGKDIKNKVKNLIYILVFLFCVTNYTIPFFTLSISPFYSLYCSFKVDIIKECFNNPMKYFNSENYTDIIINYKNYIRECQDDFYIEEEYDICENTDKSRDYSLNNNIKDDIYDIAKECFDYLLNITRINGNKNFELAQKYNKLYSLLIVANFIAIIIILLFICSDIKKYMNFTKDIILTILIFFFIIISIILSFLNLSIISELEETFIRFYYDSRKLFNNHSRVFDSEELEIIRDSKDAELRLIAFYFCLLFVPLSTSLFLVKIKKRYNNIEYSLFKRNEYEDKNLFRILIEIFRSSFYYINHYENLLLKFCFKNKINT